MFPILQPGEERIKGLCFTHGKSTVGVIKNF